VGAPGLGQLAGRALHLEVEAAQGDGVERQPTDLGGLEPVQLDRGLVAVLLAASATA